MSRVSRYVDISTYQNLQLMLFFSSFFLTTIHSTLKMLNSSSEIQQTELLLLTMRYALFTLRTTDAWGAL